MMTREELAAMTDDEILAHYRNKHGDPYMSLGAAKEMHHAAFKWWHLAIADHAHPSQPAVRRVTGAVMTSDPIPTVGRGETMTSA